MITPYSKNYTLKKNVQLLFFVYIQGGVLEFYFKILTNSKRF